MHGRLRLMDSLGQRERALRIATDRATPRTEDPALVIAQERRRYLDQLSWTYGFTRGFLAAIGVGEETRKRLRKSIDNCRPLNGALVNLGETKGREQANLFAQENEFNDAHDLRRWITSPDEQPEQVIGPSEAATPETKSQALIGAENQVPPQQEPSRDQTVTKLDPVSTQFGPTFLPPPEMP
jgi:hypothetical protein